MADGHVAGATRQVQPRPDSPLVTGPFHAALREAIQERGLTLDRLRFHLSQRGVPVAQSTLSDWQHGHRRPGGDRAVPIVRALEQILDLPGGALVRLLIAGPADPAEPPVLRPARGLDERGGVLGELLDALPGARDRGVHVLSRHNRVSVDASGLAWWMRSRTVVRAVRDGIDRYTVRYFGEEGCVIDEVRIGALENCRLGRVRRHSGSPVLVAELLFGASLAAGDTWVFEHDLVDRTGPPCTEYAYGVVEPLEQYVSEVRFDPRKLPVDCHAFAQPGLYDERRRTADLVLNDHHAVHLVAADLCAGVIGIEWSWS
jgi:hypothetical protein